MTSVWVAFLLIFAMVQLCTAEYVVYGRKMTLDDNLSLNPNRCHRPLITQLRQVVCKMSTIVNLGGLGGQNWEKEYVYIVVD